MEISNIKYDILLTNLNMLIGLWVACLLLESR